MRGLDERARVRPSVGRRAPGAGRRASGTGYWQHVKDTYLYLIVGGLFQSHWRYVVIHAFDQYRPLRVD